MARTKVARPETYNRGSGVSLPPEQWAQIRSIAEKQGKSQSEVIREAITLFLMLRANSGNLVTVPPILAGAAVDDAPLGD